MDRAGAACLKFGSSRTDSEFMLVPSPPMSNLERQRLFLKRHPGYYREYRRKREAQRQASLAAQTDTAVTSATPLALPSPSPTITIDLPLFAHLEPIPVAPQASQAPPARRAA